MKNDDDRDELDDLIDGALPGYSTTGPMHGLEERVLRRIRMAGSVPRSLWPYRLRFAAPVAALLFLAVVVPRMRWKPLSHATNTTQLRTAPNRTAIRPPSASLPRDLPAPGPQFAKARQQKRARQEDRTRPEVLPKEERFPTPAPMTQEERILLAWAMRAPAEAREAFVSLRERSDQSIVIQPIRIQPLPSDGPK